MAEFKIEVDVPEGIKQAAVIFSDEVETALRNSALDVEHSAKDHAPVAMGDLRRSIGPPEVGTIGGTVRAIIGTNLSYAKPVEFGSRPHTPPREPVFTWARRKGMNGWAVWQSIRKKGTKAHPYMRPAFEEQREPTIKRMVAAINKAVERMSK